jgi:hypothetical protein
MLVTPYRAIPIIPGTMHRKSQRCPWEISGDRAYPVQSGFTQGRGLKIVP